MKSFIKRIFRHWKIIYLVCSLAYMGWVIHVGDIEFDRINSQYQRLVKQLDTGRIRDAALEELTADCRKETREKAEPEEDDCHSWPDAGVTAKAEEVKERRLRAKERGFIKVVLFYTGFVVIFLLGPPVIIYLLLIGAIKVYRSVKFVRE